MWEDEHRCKDADPGSSVQPVLLSAEEAHEVTGVNHDWLSEFLPNHLNHLRGYFGKGMFSEALGIRILKTKQYSKHFRKSRCVHLA